MIVVITLTEVLLGDMLSLIGLGIGLPLFLYASLRHFIEGTRIPTEIVVIRDENGACARWFAGSSQMRV